MSELIEDWPRGPARARSFDPADAARGLGPVDDPPPGAGAGGLEPFGACGLCEGARFLRTEPLTTGTSRLTLVCDDCGTRTEI